MESLIDSGGDPAGRIIDDLKAFLLSQAVADLDRASLGPNLDLLVQGIVDSLGVLKLASFMEAKFKIKVMDRDIVRRNFRTLSSLARLVKRKGGG